MGDTVDTAKGSSAQLKMQDGGFIAVRPETRLKIDSFQFKGKEDGTENSFFSLFKGGFRAVTGLIGRIHKQNYRVATPVATIGIRGTDHETFVIAPGSPLAAVAPAGAYNKVNIGETYMATDKGTIFVLPNQMGFAGAKDQMPQLQPLNTNIFTVAAEPAPQGNGDKKEGKEAVRETAVVDSTSKEDTGTKQNDHVIGRANQPSIETPKVGCDSQGNCVDLTAAAAAAQQAATAAAAAQQAAAAAAALAATITPVDTIPATNAINSATNSVNNTATPLVTSAAALVPANATLAATNATTAQTAATAAGNQAAQAQAAYTTNGAFVDAILATPANTAVQAANASVQTANASVQTNAAAVTTQNTALTTAQVAASSALTAANSNLTTANSSLATANAQNAVITTSMATQNTALNNAQTAAAAAAAAATAAQTAAAMAATLQAAGNIAGAQAQVTIAQEQLAIAQQQQQAVQTALATIPATLLNSAQTAQASASAAVTAAVNSANTAAANAGAGATGAQTYASAAQTASTSAAAALAQTVAAATGTPANTVQNQAAIVAANAPIAAYNNPAVTGNFVAAVMFPVAVAGGFNEGFSPTNPLQPNTAFVLDGGGNLIEARNLPFQVQANQNGIVLTPAITGASGADIKWAGGTAADTFKLADNSLYMGRWMNATVTVTDNAIPANIYTYTPAASLWTVLLPPPAGYVQTLAGTTTFTKVGHTTPVDAFGNLGTLNSASLAANFTSQTVNAAVNLTMGAGSMTGTFDVSGIAMPINGSEFGVPNAAALTTICSGACAAGASGYSADLGGGFGGTGAASAALSYNIWPTTATTADPETNSLQGLAAFSTATAPTSGTFAAYLPIYTEIELANSYMNWGGFMAVPGNMTYIGGGLASFTQQDIGCCRTETYNVIGGATPVVVNATSFATTGIQFGRWTSATALEQINSSPLGVLGKYDKKTWMYGPAGYLDLNITAPAGQMYGTFAYALDGSTAPFDGQSRRNGTLTSASVTANFAANTFSANLALNVANQFWSASATNVGLGGMGQFYASSSPGNANNNLTVMMGAGAPTVCPTCYGSLSGAFTGQNYAGAILAYDLWNIGSQGGMATGSAALVRTGAAITNGTPVTPSQYFVSDNSSNSAYIQIVDTLNNPVYSHLLTPGGVLATYSSGSSAIPSAYYSSTTVTCSTCSVTPATNATTAGAPTGIYFGIWDAGSVTSTWGKPSLFSASPHWITGPEAGPLFLPNALVGTKSFTFDGGMVTNGYGVAGTVQGTTALTVDFTKQVVGINIDLTVPDNMAAPHTWNAKTLPGNEAVINGGNGIGGATFWASSYSNSNHGKLTVSVDGTPGNGSGYVSGQLTGVGLTGAIMSYGLTWAPLGPPYFQQVDGVVALVGTASNVLTPHRGVMTSATDLTALIPQVALGSYANDPARMLTDGAGNLTQFDMNQIMMNDKNIPSHTLASGTSALVNAGSDPVTGISWGRWAGGSVNVTNRATGTAGAVPMTGSLHWIAGPTETAAVTLPVSGTFTYTNTGGTSPTDNLGNAGTLNSATLQANFTAQTVNMGVNVTVGGTTLNASASNAPIIQKSAFYASSNDPVTSATHLAVTCSAGCGTAHQGTIVGGFGGAGAIGAVMSYGLEKISGASTQVISGVAAFKR